MSNPYSTAAEPQSFIDYVERIQSIGAAHRDDAKLLQEEALALINKVANEQTKGDVASLLHGEEAFYRGKYKAALKHYLSAQSVPNFHFFCYRASAFVSKELDRGAKAVSYARKALKIYPNDPITLKLLTDLLEGYRESEEAAELKSRFETPVEEGEIETRSFAIAEEELNELENLFVDETEEEKESMSEQTEENQATLLEPTIEAPEAPDLSAATEKSTQAIDALEQLAASDYQVETESTSNFLSTNLGVDMETGQSLESRIKRYQRSQVEAMSEYVESALKKSRSNERFLTVLHGWNYEREDLLTQQLLPSGYRHTTGGYFIRWNGKGVVINPGRSFLRNFHNAGHHVNEIDYVVVTRDDHESLEDVRAIYDLNYGQNKMAADLHIINYYLNQQSHRAINTQLKPHFKQERNTVHCLDLYVDSPDIESIALDEGITLHYFPTSSSNGAIGIKLELENRDVVALGEEGCNRVSVGYVSGAPYSPQLVNHLIGTDLLLTGFGGTNANDYGKLKHNEETLGFFGNYSLVEEVAPAILLFSEFNGREGDIRAEIARKLKQEFAYSAHNNSAVYPGDTGFRINLETLKVRSSVGSDEVDPSQVRIAKTKEAFGQLQYLSPNSFI